MVLRVERTLFLTIRVVVDLTESLLLEGEDEGSQKMTVQSSAVRDLPRLGCPQSWRCGSGGGPLARQRPAPFFGPRVPAQNTKAARHRNETKAERAR